MNYGNNPVGKQIITKSNRVNHGNNPVGKYIIAKINRVQQSVCTVGKAEIAENNRFHAAFTTFASELPRQLAVLFVQIIFFPNRIAKDGLK